MKTAWTKRVLKKARKRRLATDGSRTDREFKKLRKRLATRRRA